jgi:hypothetical protein
MPQASPGVIPPDLPAYANDDAEVSRLKTSYNATLGTLTASARTVTQAAAQNTADAQAAAQLIRNVIDNDGLNNPSGFLHWLDHAADDVTGYVSAHWVGFLKLIANVAGILATICGILAMIFAFIPGLEEFAALFETLALMYQFVAFVCHSVLAATGHGSLFEVIVDTIGLVTFGVGKGLIGSAEATADVAEEASSAYRSVLDEGDDVGTIIRAGDKASEEFEQASDVRFISKAAEKMKEVVSVRPVFKDALEAWQDGKFGDAMGDSATSTLWGGFKSAMGMSSPDIASAVERTVTAGKPMTAGVGVAWAMTSRAQVIQSQFRLAQGFGVGTDLSSKIDSIAHLIDANLPDVSTWPEKDG